ncbi:extracellular solute-binding protein [Paenibacillus macerans]|uniref:extracellular solute-binding protein n=1 Tax=Paenibacillus macerans TaxID=44252 RepID=UPI003D31F53F
MNRKWLRFTMSMLVLGSVLAGCGQNAGGGTETGGSAGAGMVTLRVAIFDRGNSPAGSTATNNYLTNWVQKEFGDPNGIKVEYVPIPRSDATEKLNVMMAGNDAPDIVFASTDNLLPYNYAKQGGLMDITALVDEYGPNLKKYLGESLDYGKVEGVQYSIPGRRVFTGKYSAIIRQDWLDKLNLPMPQTTEEVYETLKAFKEKDPGGTGGKVIPYGFSLTAASIEPLVWSFIDDGMTEEERYTLSQKIGYPLLLPGHKEAVQFANKLYNEGLISPDFALDKDGKTMLQDVMNGRVGMYTEDVGKTYLDNPGVAKVLSQNISGARLVPADPFTNKSGKHLKPKYVPTGFYLMIPAGSERGAEAIQYLDWLAQEAVMFSVFNGEEGRDYKLANELPERIESEETGNRLYNSADIAMITIGQDFGSAEKNRAAVAATVPEPFREDMKRAYEISETDPIDYANFEQPIQAELKYVSALYDKYTDIFVKSVMAKPEQFDQVYNSMLEDYMNSGGQAILEERTEAYKAMKK